MSGASLATSHFATLIPFQFLKCCTLLFISALHPKACPQRSFPWLLGQSAFSVDSANSYSSFRSHHRYHFFQGAFPHFSVQVQSPCRGTGGPVLPRPKHVYADESLSVVCDFLTGPCVPEGGEGFCVWVYLQHLTRCLGQGLSTHLKQ